jgi:DNA end-binding protein Ku
VAFVPADELDERWYERPYYLGPDGSAARYSALVAAARESADRVGIAEWVMRGHAYRGALMAEEGHLALVTLRARDEVLPAANLPAPAGEALNAGELKLADRLIEAMAGEFDWSRYRDEHPERVAALVRQKLAGKLRKRPAFKPRVVRDDALAEALKQSIKRAAG